LRLDNRYNLTQEELDKMDAYLHGRMSAAERNDFENEIAMNAELKRKYEELRLLMVGIGEASLQQKINSFHKEIGREENKAAKAKVISLKTWVWAASVAAACCIGVWMLFFNTASSDKLYDAYYKPDAGLPTVMSVSDNYSFDKAMVEYKSGNYAAAIKAWEEFETNKPGNDTLHYFLGSALLANNQKEKAIPYLENVAANDSSAFQKEASWYLGLAHLKKGDKEAAKKNIAASGRENKEQLLNKLK
jgi:TolA-binding protein